MEMTKTNTLSEVPKSSSAQSLDDASDPEGVPNCEDRAGLDAGPPEFTRKAPFEAPDRYSTKSMDQAADAYLARFTLGISPYGLASTFFTWAVHLMGAPGKQVQLVEKASRKAARLAVYAVTAARDPDCQPCIEPLAHDRRFDDGGWKRWPYNLLSQNFLLTQQWWYNAARGVDGVSDREEQVVSFVSRQMLDLMSPSNFIATNPEVATQTLRQGGANLLHGWQNFLEDWERAVSGKLPVGTENFVPGRDVAVTPGKVVFRNRLLELIQYAPSTESVKAEPILIIPAWIMKYYILDLSPENSLVRFLVDQGHTVFIASWRNPTAEDREQGMADYLQAVDEAMGAVGSIVPKRKIHAMGYCLGGTLLAAKAAQMARDGDDRLATVTLLATQTDFEEPGELQLFISESEVSFLENMMWDQGYLDTKQMAGAFQLLRSVDLIWSRYVHEYLMGRRPEMFDLMAWNADATRMPYKMHSEYLRHLFLNNELAQGKFLVGGKEVAISDIDVPVFCVSTTSDHVAPWRSVYKLHLLADTDITFVLTNGGHNAGIVSEPGHEGRAYRIRTIGKDEPYQSADDWAAAVDAHDGSWWSAFVAWLADQSSGESEPPSLGAWSGRYKAEDDAPGTYVFQL
ncbi:polyhydroxyalkanoate synthase [Jannaschia faecimaris]|uniref:Polyhydroxyalkanoate synthase n=2 Tax=Jannaschia faecimaris TaxID=1244108 RepID=A0A1H3P896_9RHOB|nr:polyhydroxyalkanoate synthase [Jannaschia faecimaris]